LTDLGVKVVEGYEKDKRSRKEWEDIAEELLSLASQDKPVQPKTTPWTTARTSTSAADHRRSPVERANVSRRDQGRRGAAVQGRRAGQRRSMKGPDGHPMVMLNGQPIQPVGSLVSRALAQQPGPRQPMHR
jgi:hypothetical protein